MTQTRDDAALWFWALAVDMADDKPEAYEDEDWRAEALLGLALALRYLRPEQWSALTIRIVIQTHLDAAREACA